MFLIIQIQTGGAGGTPNNGLLPATLLIDYVKVTQPLGAIHRGTCTLRCRLRSTVSVLCWMTPVGCLLRVNDRGVEGVESAA